MLYALLLSSYALAFASWRLHYGNDRHPHREIPWFRSGEADHPLTRREREERFYAVLAPVLFAFVVTMMVLEAASPGA